MTLAEFCKVRLDETEQAARLAAGDDWKSRAAQVFAADFSRTVAWCRHGRIDDEATADHIARHDPARALREVAAMRKILSEYEQREPGTIVRDMLGYALAVLARIWEDHPDYDEELP